MHWAALNPTSLVNLTLFIAVRLAFNSSETLTVAVRLVLCNALEAALDLEFVTLNLSAVKLAL